MFFFFSSDFSHHKMTLPKFDKYSMIRLRLYICTPKRHLFLLLFLRSFFSSILLLFLPIIPPREFIPNNRSFFPKLTRLPKTQTVNLPFLPRHSYLARLAMK